MNHLCRKKSGSVSLSFAMMAMALLFVASVVSADGPTTQPAKAAATTPAVTAPASAPAEAAASEGDSASIEKESSNWPPLPWWIAPIGAILAMIFAWKFYKEVKAANPGSEDMQRIAGHVTKGAYAYLKRQYAVVAVFFVIVCAALYWMGQVGLQHPIVFIAFLTGGFFSGLCGFLGMKTATLASNRAAQGAKESLNRGLTIAFRAGAVMGLVVVAFGLFDISLWFLLLTQVLPAIIPGFEMGLVEVTVVMLTFGMGASSQALFARVGGGIYTKAADVGADLVGKVEAGIPEDDPRNPATIADNVGDNVGDVAGMGADLYESYCGSILATAALGVAAAFGIGASVKGQLAMLSAPMVLAGVGIILSILGIYMVRTKEGASMKQLMRALMRGVVGSSVLILVAALGICWWLLSDINGVWWFGIWLAIVVGMAAGLLIGYATEYYTSYDYKPTKEVAENAETGSATVIISGLATGMKSTWFSLLVVIAAIIGAYSFAGGADSMLLGLYGVGIAAVSMLATLGITLATDAYGPIADNAGGNAEMTHQPPEVRQRTDALDSLGNTTAAMGKGFAIGSAALTALALLAAYVEEVRIGQTREGETAIVTHCGNDVIVGQAAHCGAKKIALVSDVRSNDDGEPIMDSETYMVMSNLPKGFSIGEIELTWGTEPNDDNVRKATLAHKTAKAKDKEGNDTDAPLTVAGALLVPTKKASLRQFMDFYGVNLMNPKVLCGIFAGVLLVFLFSAMTMKAVGKAAMSMVKEVRRQFKEIPGIMEGTGEPDYAKCVSISTAGAQKAMIIPSMLALIVPIVVGLILDVGGVLGLLAGGLTCGFAMAIFMANAGGAWDNAKKYIETGKHGGKGSEAHKAAVVGDTVGDPFKDTSGPSLNILIKLMSMVSVVFAGLVVKYAPIIGSWIGLE